MYNRWNGRNTEGGCTIDGTAEIQNQNRFIRSYYRPRRPPLRPIWSLSQRPPGKKYIHECMYVKVKLVNTSKS